MEILAWPTSGHANLDAVLELLSRTDAHPALMRRRYVTIVRGKKRRVNAFQRAYAELYKARNRFLHGEPVDFGTLLMRKQNKRVGLPQLAAIVYRAALVAFLRQRYSRSWRTQAQLQQHIFEVFDQHSYDEAMAELFSVKLPET